MQAFNSGFDGVSKDYPTLAKGISSGNLYAASDVAQLFQNQISKSLYEYASDTYNDRTKLNSPNTHFSELVYQGVIPQEIINQVISKQQLTKLQKGFGYDIPVIQNGILNGHLNTDDVAMAALNSLKKLTTLETLTNLNLRNLLIQRLEPLKTLDEKVAEASFNLELSKFYSEKNRIK
jgi:hypothetical protein